MSAERLISMVPVFRRRAGQAGHGALLIIRRAGTKDRTLGREPEIRARDFVDRTADMRYRTATKAPRQTALRTNAARPNRAAPATNSFAGSGTDSSSGTLRRTSDATGAGAGA